MIDSTRETLIALADVPAELPNRRGGRRPSVSGIYRWAQHGIRGIRLETLQCGGTKVTSIEAIQRFFERLGAATPADKPAGQRTPKQRRRAIARADAELDEAGI